MRVVIGIALVAVNVAAFVALAARSTGHELVVELKSPRGIDGSANDARAVVATDGAGLAHRTWTTTYRGGFSRAVGASALVGPAQDPAAPPCSGRVVVGQRLLDDLARVVGATIDDELHGETIFPIGDYLRIDDVTLRWSRDDVRALLGDAGAPNGYVRASATIVFQRARVPLVIALVPERAGAAIHFRIAAHADLAFDNRVAQWLGDKLGAGALASRFARHEIDTLLVTTFAPPPPFDLGDGQTLAFTTCDAPIEIVDGAFGAIPFGVAIGHVPSAPDILPPRFATTPLAVPAATTRLALDLDLNALDAMLYELWRTGWLDRRLDEVGLDRRFDSDPTVLEYLSVRISKLRLALPPVISPTPGGALRLAADARVAIRTEQLGADGSVTRDNDGDATTIGRVYGAIDFTFAARARAVAVDLGALELSCERTPTTLVPCYGDLVAALRDRGDEFHGALTDAFARLLAAVFVDRTLTAPGVPAELAIRGATASLVGAPPVLHLELDAALAHH
ncbi:MAG TPA: hypothetical protein VMJ10_02490 [Kofleriaceae bacterium]|nr:hypothetical protein [Kofleriaceae bacterium]